MGEDIKYAFSSLYLLYNVFQANKQQLWLKMLEESEGCVFNRSTTRQDLKTARPFHSTTSVVTRSRELWCEACDGRLNVVANHTLRMLVR